MVDSAPDYALPQRVHVRRRRRRGNESPVKKRHLAEAFPSTQGVDPSSEGQQIGGGSAEAEEEESRAYKKSNSSDETKQVSEDNNLQEHRSLAIEGHKFEYLDHTADVQCHAWGENLEEAFANVGLAMYNYMTPIKGIKMDESLSRTFHSKGHDLQSLLFNFLDELLFIFHTEFFVACELEVSMIDRKNWTIEAKGRGGTFSRELHECGTEVKAITYSAMQIHERENEAEVFVIVDI
jgi:SHS2 domain-containing protein